METKERDYLFDNYKAILIILVVVGHFIEVASEDNLGMQMLKWMIFSFHMPAFIFISGYFSKKTYSLKILCRRLLVPYLVFEMFYYLLYTFVIHKETELYLLYPKFSLWYLMALFVWKFVTPYFKKIPGHIAWAVIAGLAVGATNIDDNFLTLPRMITFYPFFLLGTMFQRKWLTRLRTVRNRISAAGIFVVLNLFLAFVDIDNLFEEKIFYGRYNYEYLGLSDTEGVFVRLGCYAISLAMTLLMAMMVSEKQNRFSYLGSRTMAIYLFHGLIYSCFKSGANFYHSLSNFAESALILTASFLVVWLLSRKPFTDFMNICCL